MDPTGTTMRSSLKLPESRPGAGATAYPGLNLWTHMGFLMDLRDPGAIDQVTYSTAHEIAHQWWAHDLGPAMIPGYGLLTEGLATFSSTMYMEKTFGKRMVRRAFEKDLDLYFHSEAGQKVRKNCYTKWMNKVRLLTEKEP